MWWIIDILKVVILKNGGHFVTVILTIEYDCMVHLIICFSDQLEKFKKFVTS